MGFLLIFIEVFWLFDTLKTGIIIYISLHQYEGGYQLKLLIP